nr:hypothetical protein [Bacteroidaceae bacterium]
TAPQCGRVGRRLFSTAVFQEKSWETVFLYVYTALFLPLLTALISLIGLQAVTIVINGFSGQ